jgi:hypothetical protein
VFSLDSELCYEILSYFIFRSWNDIDKTKANYNLGYTSPVGDYDANPFGLYDTAGNIWEWTCSEYVDRVSESVTRPTDSFNLVLKIIGTLEYKAKLCFVLQ